MWYISSKGLIDVESTMDFPLSRVEVEIMFTDVGCEMGGGLDNEKISMSEEYLMIPNPMF